MWTATFLTYRGRHSKPKERAAPICDDEDMLLRSPAVFLASACSLLAQYPATPMQTSDQRLSALLTESDHAKVLGDYAAAIKGYEAALRWVHTEAALKKREEEVLNHLAAGYIA